MDEIVLQGLRKSYRTPGGVIEAVRGIDLTVTRGETVALLGPNGAGKSTTIDMLLGLLRPDSGSVSIFGAPPASAVAAGNVGAMLQSGGLLRDLSVRELLTMMASLFPQPLPVDDVLAIAGIGELASQRTDKLSGGQQQRVRFGVSLVGNPDLLVLDEPSVGMDVESRRDFWQTVRSYAAAGKTVFFATHYLEEADAQADRIVLLAHGGVIADGAPTEIKSAVGGRRVRATLPGVSIESLERLPGVQRAERHGESVLLTCSDSDAALRALLAEHETARDIEVSGAALEDAFLELTTKPMEVSA
jgi:ABC-2 type transport system ATP-binding protein